MVPLLLPIGEPGTGRGRDGPITRDATERGAAAAARSVPAAAPTLRADELRHRSRTGRGRQAGHGQRPRPPPARRPGRGRPPAGRPSRARRPSRALRRDERAPRRPTDRPTPRGHDAAARTGRRAPPLPGGVGGRAGAGRPLRADRPGPGAAARARGRGGHRVVRPRRARGDGHPAVQRLGRGGGADRRVHARPHPRGLQGPAAHRSPAAGAPLGALLRPGAVRLHARHRRAGRDRAGGGASGPAPSE